MGLRAHTQATGKPPIKIGWLPVCLRTGTETRTYIDLRFCGYTIWRVCVRVPCPHTTTPIL